MRESWNSINEQRPHLLTNSCFVHLCYFMIHSCGFAILRLSLNIQLYRRTTIGLQSGSFITEYWPLVWPIDLLTSCWHVVVCHSWRFHCWLRVDRMLTACLPHVDCMLTRGCQRHLRVCSTITSCWLRQIIRLVRQPHKSDRSTCDANLYLAHIYSLNLLYSASLCVDWLQVITVQNARNFAHLFVERRHESKYKAWRMVFIGALLIQRNEVVGGRSARMMRIRCALHARQSVESLKMPWAL